MMSLLGAVTVAAQRRSTLEAESEIHRQSGGRVDASARFRRFLDVRRFLPRGPPRPWGPAATWRPRAGTCPFSSFPSSGAGLRFRSGDEGARIRADFAMDRKGSGLYLTMGEAF